MRARSMAPGAALVALLFALLAAGCGSSSSSTSSGTEPPPTGASATTAATRARELRVVLTNDDGYQADGIDTMVVALEALPEVMVTVVAPAKQNSGVGGKTTSGPLRVHDAQTKSGHAAHAVDGTPADTIRAAIDQLQIKPDLVVSGINEGQNLGPAIDLSGTVGAARAAVARKIPAVAVSAGLGDTVDYAAAAPYVVQWITEHRAALLAGTAPLQIVSFDVPSCNTGKIRGVREVDPDLDTSHLGASLQPANCTSTATGATTDVEAFHDGFATKSTLPLQPAS